MKKLFLNKKGQTLLELLIGLVLLMLVVYVTFTFFPTYTNLTLKYTNRIFKITVNSVRISELEQDFACASSFLSENAGNGNTWWNDGKIKVLSWTDAGEPQTFEYQFSDSSIGRGSTILIETEEGTTLKWYMLNGYNEVVATNDSTYNPSVKSIIVGDEVVDYLNDSPNVVSCVRGYYYLKIGEENFPLFFSSSRLISPEWRSSKSHSGQENYMPVFDINGVHYTYAGVMDDRTETIFKTHTVSYDDSTHQFSFTVELTDVSGNPLSDQRGIVIIKVGNNYQVYGFLTGSDGKYTDSGETVSEKPTFAHFIFFGDDIYKECEVKDVFP